MTSTMGKGLSGLFPESKKTWKCPVSKTFLLYLGIFHTSVLRQGYFPQVRPKDMSRKSGGRVMDSDR